MDNDQHFGCALVPNTLVCEVSRLFVDQAAEKQAAHLMPWQIGRHRNRKRLGDLYSLIDAACLYEKLYTLPCTLSPDVSELTLRQFLLDNGVLQTLDTSDTHAAAARAVIGGLERFSQPSSDESDVDSELDSFSPDGFSEFFQIHEGEPLPERPVNRFFDGDDAISNPFDVYELCGGRSSGALYAQSPEQLAKSLVWSMNYRSSGAYEDCTSMLRDMYYICMSESISIPYWPQLDRIEFSRRYPNFVTASTRTQLYELLANALREAVSEIEQDFNSGTTFVPPFAAIALSRSTTPEELLNNIFEVRSEFHDLRWQLGDLERQRLEATSIKDRRKIIEQHKHLLNLAAKAFDTSRVVSLEALVRYIPEIAKPVASPTDPTKYSSNLLLQPIEWLLTWWRQRPLSRLLQVADQVQELENYDKLATQVFGPKLLHET